jgi:hypothetical protein
MMKKACVFFVFCTVLFIAYSCSQDDNDVTSPQDYNATSSVASEIPVKAPSLQDLVAYYPFEGNTDDQSGYGNDGTLVGGTYVPGQVGNALAFDGDGYVRIPGVGMLDLLPGEAMTIEAWIKLAVDAPNRNAICEREIAGGECWPWYFMTFNSRELYGLVRGCTGAVSGPVLDRDRWYHVALVYENNGIQAVGTLYVDGVPYGPSNMETRNSVGGDIFIGVAMRSDYGSERFQDHFHGIIDEVKIWYGTASASVYLDIKPESCPNPINTSSKGVLPVAILGTADFDVTEIDISTLLLAGVAPIRSSIEDVASPLVDGEECECTTEGPDGLLDLTLKFMTQEIIHAMGSVANDEFRTLTITGTLLDGTPFEASDCVRIVKNKEIYAPTKGDGTLIR